jgi:hypothetical protein
MPESMGMWTAILFNVPYLILVGDLTIEMVRSSK